MDFLASSEPFNGDILTNPPYRYAQEFVEKALSIIENGRSAWFFLKLTFLEGQKRWQMFKANPPKNVFVFVKRIACSKNGVFDTSTTSAVCYAWFQFEKGWYGKPQISWVNTGEDEAQERLF